MSMKSFLLMGCLGIAALQTSAAWSITLPPHAAAKVPAAVVQKLETGTPQEVIVLFDDVGIQKEVAAMREAVGLTSDDETLLSFKKRLRHYKIKSIFQIKTHRSGGRYQL